MQRDKIFISYSHIDKKWFSEVKKHLSILEHHHQLVIWDDTKIKVGSNWKNDIEESIKSCKVAILLVSNNFLASEFILKKELPKILNATKLEGVVIFNVIIDACAFHLTDLQTYQCLNNPQFPLEELRSGERKRVLVELTTKLLDTMAAHRANTEGARVNLNQESSSFSRLLVLADLINNGPKTITEIQSTTTLRRRIVVSELEKLQNENYIVKFAQPQKNKKPSTLWKASSLGCVIFNQFEGLYNQIVQPGKRH